MGNGDGTDGGLETKDPNHHKSNTEARPGGPVAVGQWTPWLPWGRSLLLSGVTWLVLARVQVSLWHLLEAACVCGVRGQLGCWTGPLISIDASQVWGLEKGRSDSFQRGQNWSLNLSEACLSLHLFIYNSSICLSIHLFILLSHSFIFLSIHLSIYLSIHHSSICVIIHPFVHPSVPPSVHPSICPSVCPCSLIIEVAVVGTHRLDPNSTPHLVSEVALGPWVISPLQSSALSLGG